MCHLLVPIAILFPIKCKMFGGQTTRFMSPAIGEQHAADIEKDSGNHRRPYVEKRRSANHLISSSRETTRYYRRDLGQKTLFKNCHRQIFLSVLKPRLKKLSNLTII